MSKKISVIVPVYNSIECLERCVRSICAQTYQNLEILLVDDGSTDGTGELCERLSSEDQRIRVAHKKNGGASSARNVGLKMAEGEYLGFVDSDDYIEPYVYEKMARALEEGKYPVVQISRDEVDESGRRLADVCVPPAQAWFCDAGNFIKELLLHRGDCSFCTKLFPREVFAGHRFPEGELNEDFRLLLELFQEISCGVQAGKHDQKTDEGQLFAGVFGYRRQRGQDTGTGGEKISGSLCVCDSI